MVVTRSQTQLGTSTSVPSNNDTTNPTVVHDQAPSTSRRTHTVSSQSGRSSATAVARRRAVEAQHVRHLAQLELAEMQAQLNAREAELERKATEADHQAELAAIDAEQCSRSRSRSQSHVSVKQWLDSASAPEMMETFPEKRHFPEISQMRPDTYNRANPTTNCNKNNGTVTVNELVQALQILTPKSSACNKKIDLPVFDGKSPIEWLMFKRAFFDTSASFTDAENLARLSRVLKGAAREAVSMLLVMAPHARDVIDVLDRRFGRPEVIVLQEVNAVRALPRVGPEVKDLCVFATRVRNCVEVVKLLAHYDYIRSPELFGALLSKLPPPLRTRWLDFAASHIEEGQARVEVLSCFLDREVDLLLKYGAVAEPTTLAVTHHHRVHTTSETSTGAFSKHFVAETEKHENKINFCLFCQQQHQLTSCQKFKSLTVEERWIFVKKNKICHRCLQKGSHIFKFCNKNKTGCETVNCRLKHHSLLHNPNFNTSTTQFTEPGSTPTFNEPISKKEGENVAMNTVATVSDLSQRPLLKVVAVSLSGPTGCVDTYALLDDGSTATFIDAEISSQIGAKGNEGHIHLNCVGGLSKDSSVQYVNFKIKGKTSSQWFPIQNARSIAKLGLTCQSATRESIQNYSYLTDLTDKLCYDVAKPMLVIGIDNWHLITGSNIRKGTKSQPAAIETPLGWALFGFTSSRTKSVNMESSYNISVHEGDDPKRELEAIIKQQYRLDSIGITKHETRSDCDQRALHILQQTTRRMPCGRFQVGLLWKADNLKVPDSYPLAFSRLKNLEKKMLKDPEYAKRYRANITDILNKGYAEECTESPSTSLYWYLPHFGVVNPKKPTKLRVVHDAAAKVQGVSLNSLLLTGPDLLQPLLGILMRFREEKVALTADVKEMFPQVKIQEQDRDAQRFLWRDNPTDPLKTYRMTSMIFGACSSPSTAIFVMNKNASEFQTEYPEAVEAISRDTYMDDYIGSIRTVESAARIVANIVEVHRRGGFEMRGWVSNEPSALSQLPKDIISDLSLADQTSVDLGNLQEITSTRTLGLIWKPIPDVIGFDTGLKENMPDHFTKRVVLAQVMRIYDPLNILAPVVIKGRILFQNLWRKSLEWDEKLSEADHIAWHEWFDSLKPISDLQVPRCYSLSSYIELELHVFCDASELAYAAVAYWRFVLPNQDTKVSLIASKARVSPLKPISIPRLELQGALIATRLANTICEVHRFKPNRRYFWCDSMTVLGWLRSDARNFKPFVAHRVGEINENSNLNEWRWIPGELNVADDATRGKRTIEPRWLFGPSFLSSPASEWPTEPSLTIPRTLGQEELKPSFTVESINFINTNQLHKPVSADITHFSSWNRLVRATARLHQFITIIFRGRGHIFQNLWVRDICSNSNKVDRDLQPAALCATAPAPLNVQDIVRAERHILGISQLNAFTEELRTLKNGLPVSKKSRLASLSPQLNNGLLHLSGRISAVTNRQPIILDGKEPAVHLLIRHYHVKFAHANTETVINELRQEYWILGIRNAVRSVVHKCQMCKLMKAPTLQPPMADLPKERLDHGRRPFTHTGLDYFGPVEVSIGRRREKRWVALFTCMVSRAIHLEIVSTLSSDSAIMCLRRFIARRGTPSTLISDNGTAFVGANRQLKVLYDASVMEYTTQEKILWSFIPPSAPFMGGAWERLIRCVKTALKVTLKERAPREEVFATLLAEAEAIVNARPLTHVSPDPEYPEAITPNHLLMGDSSGRVFPHQKLSDADLMGRSNWRKALRLADHFWRRWVTEYLPTLAPRRVPGVDIAVKVGDPVLIGDGNLPRGTWPRGVITALFPGRDGVVRVVDVQTAGGVLRRPLKKIVLL